MECATFADEIKHRGWNDQADLHFVDTPFFDDGFIAKVESEDYNITWAIVSNMMKFLNPFSYRT